MTSLSIRPLPALLAAPWPVLRARERRIDRREPDAVPLARLAADLGIALDAQEAARLPCRLRRLRAGETLFRVGAPREASYVLRRGLVRREGERAARALAWPQAVLALEGCRTRRHTATTRAITDVEVAAIPLHELRRFEASDALLARIVSESESVALMRQWARFNLSRHCEPAQRIVASLADIAALAAGESWETQNLRLHADDLAAWLDVPAAEVRQVLELLQRWEVVGMERATVIALDAYALPIVHRRLAAGAAAASPRLLSPRATAHAPPERIRA